VAERAPRDPLEVLLPEYALLGSVLGATWSASLTRTSIFVITLSAAGIALGFAAQAGVEQPTFRVLCLIVLPIVVFLGVATFVRLVQLQREAVVYLTGMNRIRHYFAEVAPGSRPYLILPTYDDRHAVFRSPGTGMGKRPRLVAQTQGVVGVITAAVAAGLVGMAVLPLGAGMAIALAAVTFLGTLATLFGYWQRSLADVLSAIEPRFPTPPDEVGRPF
jgi:hypothetical protein